MHNTEVYKLLAKQIPVDNILQNESMKKHTSFKIGGNAEFFVKAKNVEQIKYIQNICKTNNIPLTVVGNGSNLLVKDNGIKGIVLKIDIDEIQISKVFSENKEYNSCMENNNISETDETSQNSIIITVGAGVLLAKLAQILLKSSISGFEFASGIPGTIGGAIRMNAGAYGGELKDIVLETTCLTENGEIIKLNNEQQNFAYRTSIFKEKKYIILEAKLQLKYTENTEEIKQKMEEYKKSRIEKQPIEFPSAGSTFKRGNDFITAKLIDECGLKGYNIGGAEIATKHAGFIINKGNATAEDVLKLVEIVKKAVLEKFNKNIELEIEVIGQ